MCRRGERERVEELGRYGVLDTEDEAEFDELAALAAQICETPIALVSLVDGDRQWFKARHDFAVQQTPRDQPFCAHAIVKAGPLVVDDAHADPRFRDNPLVTGDPRIRFYAGTPMTSRSGYKLGTLCVIDRKPRRLRPDQLRALELLGHQAAALLELRRQRDELADELRGSDQAEHAVSLAWDAIHELSRRVRQVCWVIGDEDGRIDYISPSFDFMWGHDRASYTGQPPTALAELVHERDRDRVRSASPNEVIEYRVLRRDGSLRWVRQEGLPLEGNVPRTLVVAEDVTDERAAQIALRETEERLSLLVDSVAEYAIFVLDPDGRVATWNRGAERIKGYGADEIVGTHFSRFYTEDDRADGLPERILDTARSAGRYSGEGWRVRKDGSRFWALVTITALRDDDGELRGFAKITRDMTERRAAERRFQEVVERLTDALWIADPETLRVTFVNEAYERIWGRSREELYERLEAWGDSVHPDDRDDVAAAGREWRRTGHFHRDLRIVRPDGEVRWIRARAFPVLDADDETVLLAGIGEDITDQRAAAEQHRLLEGRINESQKLEAVGRLAGGIAHDFNNVLAVIHGAASMIGMLEPTDEVRVESDAIVRASTRAAKLVEQLMAISRPETSTTASVDLGELARDMDELLRRTLGEQIRLELDTAPDLPPARLERTHAEQIVLNLAVNARDEMTGGGTLTMSLIARQVAPEEAARLRIEPGHHVSLTVTDTGPGIPDDVRDRIFDPFFTTKGGGTGLGLSTIERIARSAGGAIGATNRPEGGASFEVLVPVAAQAAEPVADEHAGRPPRAAGATVLLVEDEPPLRRVIQRTLEREGYTVVAPPSAGEARDLIASGEPDFDILLSDVVMPEVSGPDLVDELRRRRPGTPVILVSGYAPENLGVADLTGVSLLPKPFRPEQLLGELRVQLQARG